MDSEQGKPRSDEIEIEGGKRSRVLCYGLDECLGGAACQSFQEIGPVLPGPQQNNKAGSSGPHSCNRLIVEFLSGKLKKHVDTSRALVDQI